MPTIRSVFPITVQAEVAISRDFYLNREKQVAKAFYDQLLGMTEDDAIDFLVERMTLRGEGRAIREGQSPD